MEAIPENRFKGDTLNTPFVPPVQQLHHETQSRKRLLRDAINLSGTMRAKANEAHGIQFQARYMNAN